MKIDYIANLRLPTYRAHGVQITKTCEQFAELGHDVQLIVPAKKHTIGGSDDPFTTYGIKKNFTYLRLPTLDLLGWTHAFGSLFYRIDLYVFLCALSLTRATRQGSVIYVRDPLLLSPFSPEQHVLAVEVHEIPKRSYRFYRHLKRAHVIIVITSGLRDELVANGFSRDRISISPDGVDLDSFAHPQGKADARTRLGLPIDEKLAFYIGRLDGWKGVDTLFEASKELLPDIKVVVIGGDAGGEVNRLQERYPDIYFLGNRPYRELPDNQAAADVLVLPNTATHATSARFTSPLKLFAYMASGRPIVSSDLPSIREVLNDQNAFLVKPDDAHALADGIRQALGLEKLAQARSQQALIDIQAYTWRKRVEKIVMVLEVAQAPVA